MSIDDTNSETSETDWIYRESTKKMLMRALYIACGLSIVAELFVFKRETHGPDWGFGFYATLGFVCCTIMIFAAKALSFVLKKPTDFYADADDGEEDAS